MDDLAKQARARGIHGPRLQPHRLEGGRQPHHQALEDKDLSHPIVIAGHSLGANSAVSMANYLAQNGVPVDLVVPFDPTLRRVVEGDVNLVVNYYIPNGASNTVVGGSGFSGEIINVNVSDMRGVGHMNVEKSKELHDKCFETLNASPVRAAGPAGKADRRRLSFQVPACGVERNRRGIRDVQRLDGARHVEAGQRPHGGACFLAQPLALGTQHQRDARPLEGCLQRCRPFRSRPMVWKPRRLSSSIASARLTTGCGGISSSAPEADLASTPDSCGLCRRVVTSAPAPSATAERMMAPTLCGIGDLVEHQQQPAVRQLRDGQRNERPGLDGHALVMASADTIRSMALGCTISTGKGRATGSATCSRASALRVTCMRLMVRCGLSIAARTVCRPYNITCSGGCGRPFDAPLPAAGPRCATLASRQARRRLANCRSRSRRASDFCFGSWCASKEGRRCWQRFSGPHRARRMATWPKPENFRPARVDRNRRCLHNPGADSPASSVVNGQMPQVT